jgi:CO/xanthine dehydrogenase Mo-binding subunit
LAVQRAAEDAREQLLRLAAEQLELDAGDLAVGGGQIYPVGTPERAVAVGAVARAAHWRRGGPILGRGSVYTTEEPRPALHAEGFVSDNKHKVAFAAQAVEVEVDRETGVVRPLKVVSVHDVGRAINPQSVEGQIEGAVVQGLGYALGEEVVLEDGVVANTLLNDYRVPLAAQQPAVEPVIVEAPDADGPYGAKGVGEHGLIGIASAVAQAVEQATGVRIRSLPITPAKIIEGLNAHDS